MSRQVTLEIPDETYDHYQRLAHDTGKDIETVLLEAIERGLARLEKQFPYEANQGLDR